MFFHISQPLHKLYCLSGLYALPPLLLSVTSCWSLKPKLNVAFLGAFPNSHRESWYTAATGIRTNPCGYLPAQTPRCSSLSPLDTKRGGHTSYTFLPRFVPITGKALLSFIHLSNKHGAIDGLVLKNILNIVPDITEYTLL